MSDQTHELELSNGVTVVVGSVDPTSYLEVLSDLNAKSPKPPQVYVKAIRTYQPNYDHPQYIQDVERHQLEFTSRMIDFFLADGVKSVKCPKGVGDWNSDQFEARMAVLGLQIPQIEEFRKLKWLKLVACKSQEDLNKITTEIARLSGVAESDVQNAENAFPGETGK